MENDQRTKDRQAEKAREVADSRIIAERGQRAARFLRDKFWLEDLEPTLAKIQQDAIDQKGYRPNSGKTLDETALSNAYFTGADDTMGEILRKIKLMVAAGLEAEAYLKKSEEDKK